MQLGGKRQSDDDFVEIDHLKVGIIDIAKSPPAIFNSRT